MKNCGTHEIPQSPAKPPLPPGDTKGFLDSKVSAKQKAKPLCSGTAKRKAKGTGLKRQREEGFEKKLSRAS